MLFPHVQIGSIYPRKKWLMFFLDDKSLIFFPELPRSNNSTLTDCCTAVPCAGEIFSLRTRHMFWDKGWGLEADLDEPTHASDELHAKTLASMARREKEPMLTCSCFSGC